MFTQWFLYSKEWYTPPPGWVEASEDDFKREVARLAGRGYRPHAFKNCIYNSLSQTEIHILWAKPARGATT